MDGGIPDEAWMLAQRKDSQGTKDESCLFVFRSTLKLHLRVGWTNSLRHPLNASSCVCNVTTPSVQR